MDSDDGIDIDGIGYSTFSGGISNSGAITALDDLGIEIRNVAQAGNRNGAPRSETNTNGDLASCAATDRALQGPQCP